MGTSPDRLFDYGLSVDSAFGYGDVLMVQFDSDEVAIVSQGNERGTTTSTSANVNFV